MPRGKPRSSTGQPKPVTESPGPPVPQQGDQVPPADHQNTENTPELGQTTVNGKLRFLPGQNRRCVAQWFGFGIWCAHFGWSVPPRLVTHQLEIELIQISQVHHAQQDLASQSASIQVHSPNFLRRPRLRTNRHSLQHRRPARPPQQLLPTRHPKQRGSQE